MIIRVKCELRTRRVEVRDDATVAALLRDLKTLLRFQQSKSLRFKACGYRVSGHSLYLEDHLHTKVSHLIAENTLIKVTLAWTLGRVTKMTCLTASAVGATVVSGGGAVPFFVGYMMGGYGAGYVVGRAWDQVAIVIGDYPVGVIHAILSVGEADHFVDAITNY